MKRPGSFSALSLTVCEAKLRQTGTPLRTNYLNRGPAHDSALAAMRFSGTALKMSLLLHIPCLFKAGDARRITAAEMKYMRRTARYTRTDYKTKAQIEKELKNTKFGQFTGIQEKLDTACKWNASK